MVWIIYINTFNRSNLAYISELFAFCPSPLSFLVVLMYFQTFAEKTLGPVAWIIALLIAVTQIGSLNSGILVGSRYVYSPDAERKILVNKTFLTNLT